MVDVACGDQHSIVRTALGDVYAFGRNQNGQLGLGGDQDVMQPRQVVALKGIKVTGVACGAEHSVACSEAGEVYAWGWGRYGNLGNGTREDAATPSRCIGLEGVKVTKGRGAGSPLPACDAIQLVHMTGGPASAVACGWRHSIAVSEEGRLFTWGWSKYGQLGHCDFGDRTEAAEVEAFRGRPVRSAAGGWRHTLAITEDGTLWSWGWNRYGQLGRETGSGPVEAGGESCSAAPAAVEGLAGKNVDLMACGWKHSVAVCRDGDVYTWGRGVNGQLGHGDSSDLTRPRQGARGNAVVAARAATTPPPPVLCRRLDALCRSKVSLEALRAALPTGDGGAAGRSDRFGVVPDQAPAPATLAHSIDHGLPEAAEVSRASAEGAAAPLCPHGCPPRS